MSSSFDHFKGRIILHVMITVQEGQADKAQNLLKGIQEHALSDKEPGCFTYRIVRSGNEFIVFEEYENAAAIKLHNESPPLKALFAEMQK
ncbi:hypothetical protein FRC08_003691, partial [Ceratobasidium sp. 394]